MTNGNIAFNMAVEAEKFKEVRRRLKDAQKDMRRGLNASIRRSVNGLKDDVRQSALTTLPKRGGFAERIAGSRFSIRQTATAVKFKMENPYQLKRVNAGQLRHPVYGNRSTWVFQQVRPGFWSKPVDHRIPVVRREISAYLDEVVQKIEG